MTLILSLCAASAHAAPDKRELQAREDFAAGRYQEALDLFAKLYAEKLHPNYLRNIGRCYQNLGDPDKAISSFHEYLRKVKGIAPDERREVEGYIKEMEDLAARRKGSPPAAAEPPPAAPRPLVTAAAPPPAATTPTLLEKPMAPSAEPASESPPLYKRWWVWAIVGGVVVAGAGLAAAGVFTSKKDAGCEPGRVCP
jgi:hypothetical protein